MKDCILNDSVDTATLMNFKEKLDDTEETYLIKAALVAALKRRMLDQKLDNSKHTVERNAILILLFHCYFLQ